MEAECRDCFIAFATPQQLEAHEREFHGRHRRGRGRRSVPINLPPPSPPVEVPPRRRGGRTEEEGLRVIDDDLGNALY